MQDTIRHTKVRLTCKALRNLTWISKNDTGRELAATDIPPLCTGCSMNRKAG